MQQKIEVTNVQNLGAGLVTFPNLFNLPPGASPNCLNVRFGVDNSVDRRLGSNTTNATVLISSAVTGFSPDSSGTLATNLQAFWKLNEQSGSRLDEFSTNNLTDNNTVGFMVGVLLNAGSFIAANTEFFSIVHNANLSVGNVDWSLSAWVNPSADIGTRQRAIASKDGVSPNRGWTLFWDGADGTNKRLRFEVANSGGVSDTSVVGVGTPRLNSWNFVVISHSVASAGSAALIIQVSNAAAQSAFYNTDSIVVDATSAAFRLGWQAREVRDLWDGGIDEVGFWKKVLTSQERTDLFNSGNANTYDKGASNSGFGMFDFGAGLVSGQQLRWLVVAAGTGIFASSNRGVSVVAVATDRGADYQEFTGSRSFLIATSNTQNKVLVWPGSTGTFMTALAPGSAPPAKHALDFAGFLFLMNHSGGLRQIRYADNTLIQTDAWTNSFTIEGELDDEITDGAAYQRSAYLYTKHTVSRVTHVGGNPDFSTQLVGQFGAVPRTVERATYLDKGEVLISFGYDRHVRIFDGSESIIISSQIEQSNGMSDAYLENVNIANLEKSHAKVDTLEQTYRLWVVISPSVQITHCFCLNLRTGAWYPYLNQDVNAAVMAESGNSTLFMAVKRDGFIHVLNSGNTDSGTAIADSYDSPLFFTQTPRTVTKSQKMVLYFFPTSSGSVYYSDRTNLNTAFGAPRERIALTNTSDMIQVSKVIDIPQTQNVYQFRLSSSSATTVPWKLTRVDFEHQDMGIGGG